MTRFHLPPEEIDRAVAALLVKAKERLTSPDGSERITGQLGNVVVEPFFRFVYALYNEKAPLGDETKAMANILAWMVRTFVHANTSDSVLQEALETITVDLMLDNLAKMAAGAGEVIGTMKGEPL